jgi:hypothetical protein
LFCRFEHPVVYLAHLPTVDLAEAFINLAKRLGATRDRLGSIQQSLALVNGSHLALQLLRLNTLTDSLLAGYGRVPESLDVAPKRVAVQSRTTVPGSKTVKIRYGPFKVPNRNKRSLLGLDGMLTNVTITQAEKYDTIIS